MTHKIYRYEAYIYGEPSKGPYTGYMHFRHIKEHVNFNNRLNNSHCNDETHLGARIDFNNFNKGKEFCACASIEDLKAWFKGYNKTILDLGYNLVELEVKKYILGKSKKQCTYRLKDVISRTVLK